MATTTAQRTFIQRIGCLVPCVIPATLLDAEPLDIEDPSSLRADASREDGLSFIQVKYALEDGLYLSRVAAAPDRIAQGYTVLFTEEQLYFALPWDERLQDQSADRIQDQLRACAAEVRPSKKIPAPREAASLSSASLTPIDTVEVSREALQDALALVTKKGNNADSTQHSTNQAQVQQALLCAAIDALMNQLYQTQERVQALTIQARCALLARLQRWQRHTQERLVNTVAAFSTERQEVVWRLTIGLPASFSSSVQC